MAQWRWRMGEGDRHERKAPDWLGISLSGATAPSTSTNKERVDLKNRIIKSDLK